MGSKEIFELIIKWAVPFLCAGIFAVCVKPLLKDLMAGRKSRMQNVWNEQSQALQTEVDNLKRASAEGDAALHKEIGELRTDLNNNTAGVRDALLEIHLRNLITDSKRYIQRGYITIEELDNYTNRYRVYQALGGNGHMDPWYPKVLALPVQTEHEEE